MEEIKRAALCLLLLSTSLLFASCEPTPPPFDQTLKDNKTQGTSSVDYLDSFNGVVEGAIVDEGEVRKAEVVCSDLKKMDHPLFVLHLDYHDLYGSDAQCEDIESKSCEFIAVNRKTHQCAGTFTMAGEVTELSKTQVSDLFGGPRPEPLPKRAKEWMAGILAGHEDGRFYNVETVKGGGLIIEGAQSIALFD